MPLAVFLIYMTVMDPRAQVEWRAPYYAATALALVGTLVLWRAGATLNRIYLGIALYFVSGTIALITRWPWLNAEYGRLEGTAMLFWVLAVGLVATLASARGYVGVEAPPRDVRNASWLLLAITTAATITGSMSTATISRGAKCRASRPNARPCPQPTSSRRPIECMR